MLLESAGMRPASAKIPRVVVVVTDGGYKPDSGYASQNPTSEARKLRTNGVVVFAVGVQGYVRSQLNTMVASNDHVKTISDFSGMIKAVKEVSTKVCTAVVEYAPPTTTTRATTTTTTKTATVGMVIPKCNKPVDLIFLIDASGSIASECPDKSSPTACWEKQIDFVKKVCSSFTIGKGATEARVAVVTFGSGADMEFSLDKHATNAAVDAALDSIKYKPGQSTRTRKGFDKVRSRVLKTRNGMRETKDGVPRVIVTITDGAHAGGFYNPKTVASQLRASGVTQFAVGINKYVQSQLNEIASDPPSMYTKTVNQFAELVNAVKDVSASVCKAVHTDMEGSSTPGTCDRPVDLMIVLDRSGSIAQACTSTYPKTGTSYDQLCSGGSSGYRCGVNKCWREMLDFARKLAASFAVGDGDSKSRVGLITFAAGTTSRSAATVQVELGKHNSNALVDAAIEDVMVRVRPQGGTETSVALETARDYMTEAKGARPDSQNIPKVVVVLTDGQSSPGYAPKTMAEEIRKKGISMFAVGIKNYAPTELRDIGSSPPSTFVKEIRDFDGLRTAVKEVAEEVCDTVIEKTSTGDVTVGTSGSGVGIPLMHYRERCDQAVDLMFALDESGSIRAQNWGAMKNFVTQVTQSFTISQDDNKARVGLVKFGLGAKTMFTLDTHGSNSEAVAAITGLDYGNGRSTHIKKGLQEVSNTLMAQADGLRASWKGVPRVVIVLTDGAASPSTQNGESAARDLEREDGAIVFAVGVKGYSLNELKELATDPKNHVFTIAEFSELAAAVEGVVKAVCSAVVEKKEEIKEEEESTPICHAGNPTVFPPKCKLIPEPDFTSTTNDNYKTNFGMVCGGGSPSAPHVCDGAFTGYTSGQALTGEWAGVTPAIGRYTNAYINYDGTHLHILNDW